ncbi:2-dehydropantoate 2-reductase N-terminal domain-containing protein [Microlunatus endophyticus]
MFGRGVISTIYGWALADAGNQVEFYVRPGKAQLLGPSVRLELRDGRRLRSTKINEQWPTTLIERIDAGHDYDVIIVSVNHDQLDAALGVLRDKVGDATVLIFNNVWTEPADAITALPSDHVVWGFPGGGGGFTDGQLRGALLRTMFLGDIDGSSTTARHRQVRNLFRRAGFTVMVSKDFRSWLWSHFLLDTALATRALYTGSFSAVLNSRAELAEAARIARELIPVMIMKGGQPGPTERIVQFLAPRLIARILKQVLGAGGIPRFIMEQVDHSAAGRPESAATYAGDVLATARRYGVAVPRLEEAASRFPIINDRAEELRSAMSGS